MAGHFLENQVAEQEANRVAEKFANSTDVAKDMGDAYDFDFSNVNMHEGGTDGIATTRGNDIYFGGEILSSSTPEANIVKGHELTHVMQQSGVDGMESVPYGTEQDFSFSGMFRNIGTFFRSIFGGGKKKKNRGSEPQPVEGPESIVELPLKEGPQSEEVSQPEIEPEPQLEEVLQAVVEPEPQPVVEPQPEEVLPPEVIPESQPIVEPQPEVIPQSQPIVEPQPVVEPPSQPEIQKSEESEREALFQQLQDMGIYINAAMKKKTAEQLREEIVKIKIVEKIKNGGVMEGFEEPDPKNRNKADLSKEQLAELRKKDFFNENIKSVAKIQQKKGVKDTVNKNSLKIMRYSQGFYYAQLLAKNTPFGKAFYKKLEDSGQTLLWERLYKGLKPVFLNKKGNYISEKDKQSHEWNMQFLRDVAGNEGTSTMESLTDEIVGYANVIDTIVDTPERTEEIILGNYDVIGRLTVLGLTMDNLGKTDAYKKYLRSLNGNVEPKDKSEWPPKARYADLIVNIVSTLSAYLETVANNNGLRFNNLETEFISPDKKQKGIPKVSVEMVKLLMDAEKDEYNKAKQDYLASNK